MILDNIIKKVEVSGSITLERSSKFFKPVLSAFINSEKIRVKTDNYDGLMDVIDAENITNNVTTFTLMGYE